MCKKVTGIVDGQPAVLRECSHMFIESTGKCNSNATIRIEKRFSDAATGCTCTDDGCNGVAGLQLGHNVSLFAIIIFVICKLVNQLD